MPIQGIIPTGTPLRRYKEEMPAGEEYPVVCNMVQSS